jgi:hypothetical protein
MLPYHGLFNVWYQSITVFRHKTILEISKAYGGMLVVCCDIAELSGLVGSNSIPAMRDALANMDTQSIPDGLSLPSLCAGYVKVGDLLAIPMGSIVISKAINGDASGLRTGCCDLTRQPLTLTV